MDENRIPGAAKEVGGKIQGAVGDVTGDREAQGTANQAKGSVENLYGQAKDAVRDVAEQVGGVATDAIEKGRRTFPDAERTAKRAAAAAVSMAARC